MRSTLLGEFNLSNLLAVIATVCAQGFDFQQVLSLIPELRAVDGRMQRLAADDSSPQVVVDYAHTPDALEKALVSLQPYCTGKLWCVFGCGGDRDRGKRAQMGEVASRYADRVVLTSDNPRSESSEVIIEEIKRGVLPELEASALWVEEDRRVAIRTAIVQADKKDAVLIAGKGHERYQEVAGVRWPFDDVAEAMVALKRLKSEQAGSGQAESES